VNRPVGPSSDLVNQHIRELLGDRPPEDKILRGVWTIMRKLHDDLDALYVLSDAVTTATPRPLCSRTSVLGRSASVAHETTSQRRRSA
jgi:hypothetical protein